MNPIILFFLWLVVGTATKPAPAPTSDEACYGKDTACLIDASLFLTKPVTKPTPRRDAIVTTENRR